MRSSSTGTSALGSEYQSQFGREILTSMRIRTTIMGVLGAVATMIVGTSQIVFWYLERDFPPGRLLPIMASLALCEFVLRWYINRCIICAIPVQPRVWYLNVCIEISFVTLLMVQVLPGLTYLMYSLSTPPVLVYSLPLTSTQPKVSSW